LCKRSRCKFDGLFEPLIKIFAVRTSHDAEDVSVLWLVHFEKSEIC
jgi:hypothetical protein